MSIFIMRDLQCGLEEKINASSLKEACGYAEDWLRDGDYTNSSTIYIRAEVWEEGKPDIRETVQVRIDPSEPRCHELFSQHDWHRDEERTSFLGIAENCRYCEWQKITDTWGTNSATGESGVTIVTYREHEYGSRS